MNPLSAKESRSFVFKKMYQNIKMSMDLGHSKGYIQSISSGRALPSLSEFLSICEYFNITPIEFFDENRQEKAVTFELHNEIANLKQDDMKLLIQLAKRLTK